MVDVFQKVGSGVVDGFWPHVMLDIVSILSLLHRTFCIPPSEIVCDVEVVGDEIVEDDSLTEGFPSETNMH